MNWIATNQTNENGWSNGGFDCEKNKWYASVTLKNGEHFYKESISHRVVAKWLEEKRKEYDLR